MSTQSIQEKSLIIRNETIEEANSKERISDVIDDINSSKLDKGEYGGTAEDLVNVILWKEQERISEDENLNTAINLAYSQITNKQDKLQDIPANSNVGVSKLDSEASEKLDVNGNLKADNLKAQSTQFQLQSFINPTPNTLVPKTDGSGLIWYNNNSVPTSLENIKESGLMSEVNSYLRPNTFRLIRNNSIEHSSINDTSNPIKLKTNGDGDDYYSFVPFEFFTLYNVVITIEWFSRMVNKNGTITQYNGTPNYKLWLPAGSLIKVFAGIIKIL